MRNESGINSIIAPYTSNSSGVAILFNNNIELDIHKSKTDPDGNYIIADITVEVIRLTLATVYGPNQDNPGFYISLFKFINEYDNESIIVCGDWNLVRNPDVDLENYKNTNNPKARHIK